jgi:hypothetical protein
MAYENKSKFVSINRKYFEDLKKENYEKTNKLFLAQRKLDKVKEALEWTASR